MAKAIEDAIAALQYKDADKDHPGTCCNGHSGFPAAATPAPAAAATPQYTIPQTGDTSSPALLVVHMLVSGSAAIGTAVVANKKEQQITEQPPFHLPGKAKAPQRCGAFLLPQSKK